MKTEKASACKKLFSAWIKNAKDLSTKGRKKKSSAKKGKEKKADLRSDLMEAVYAHPELMGAGLGAGVGGLGGGLYGYLSGDEDVALPALLGALLGGGAGGAAGHFGRQPIRNWAMRERLRPELSKAISAIQEAVSKIPEAVKEEVVEPAQEWVERPASITEWSREITPEQRARAKAEIAKRRAAGEEAHKRDIGLVGQGIEGIGEAAEALARPVEEAASRAGGAIAGGAQKAVEAPGRAANYYGRLWDELGRKVWGFQHR